ncbi:hypothetical protein ACSSS7_007186 [Eimeria intestinalis]
MAAAKAAAAAAAIAPGSGLLDSRGLYAAEVRGSREKKEGHTEPRASWPSLSGWGPPIKFSAKAGRCPWGGGEGEGPSCRGDPTATIGG